jgi:hypothetical protein
MGCNNRRNIDHRTTRRTRLEALLLIEDAIEKQTSKVMRYIDEQETTTRVGLFHINWK